MGMTARQRGKKVLVTYQRDKKRVTWTVPTMTDAKALMRMVRDKELDGINPVEAVERHRASSQTVTAHPTLREAMEKWIARQIENQEFRGATGEAYSYALATWAYPTLGDASVGKITRVMIGAVIERMRAAKKSRALIAHVRMPLKGLYTWLIDGEESLKGMVNPAADLKLYVGKRAHRRKDPAKLDYFTQDEGPMLLDAARGYGTRWAA